MLSGRGLYDLAPLRLFLDAEPQVLTQHQRLQASGIDVSRPWLTQISQKGISLLAPIYAAQYGSVLSSRVNIRAHRRHIAGLG